MRKVIVLLTVLLLASNLFAQHDEYLINFDYPNAYSDLLIIDTAANHDNIWQIGVPNKAVFNSAYSGAHAIVTDVDSAYPTNDTSSFILMNYRYSPDYIQGGANMLYLNFWYKMNSDTLTDFGKVEASIDNGKTWINFLTEDSIYGFRWWAPKPVLTGRLTGWQRFALDLSSLTYNVGFSDTLLYRFTFISDSIQTNKDGWMIDDINYVDMWEGIEDFGFNDLITIYPNPTKGEISFENKNEKVQVYDINICDIDGRVVLNQKVYSNRLKLDLPNGLYFMRLADTEHVYMKKLIIEK